MSKGLISRWIADWLGHADVVSRQNGSFSPFTALQQALGIVALIFSQSIFKDLAELSSTSILIFRIVLIILITFLCNHIVVAKEKLPSLKGAPVTQTTYKYSNLDRLTSKIALFLSIVVLIIIIIWPKVKSTLLNSSQSSYTLEAASENFDISTSGSSTKKFTLKLQENDKLVGEITLIFFPKNNIFKINKIIDNKGNEVQEYKNSTSGGDKNVLQNWDVLEFKIGSHNYAMRIGYHGGGNIRINYFRRI